MQPVTKWYRTDPVNGTVFNHLEDGHAVGQRPTPKVEAHRSAWASGRWDRRHAWLTDERPPRVVYYGPALETEDRNVK